MLVSTREQFELVLSKVAGAEVVIDTETSGLDVWYKDLLCGIGLSFSEDEGYYLPFRHKIKDEPLFSIFDSEVELNLPIKWLQELFVVLGQAKTLVGHNLKFDLAAMSRDGFSLGEQRLEDTIVGARMCFPDKHADLSLAGCIKALFSKEASSYKGDFWDYLKEHGIKQRADYASPEIAAEYCVGDTSWTLKARNTFLKQIEETGQRRVWDQECEVLSVLHDTERTGFLFDEAYCKRQLPKLTATSEKLAQAIYVFAGREFDIASNKELGIVMAELGINPVAFNKPKKDGTVVAKWDKAALGSLRHGIGKLIIEWRKVEHLKNTYFQPLIGIKELSGRCVIHPNIKSWGTVTGRCSCENPNLQNLTRGEFEFDVSFDDQEAASVRRLYIPRPGFSLWLFDYAQMEMRVFADFVGDKEFIARLEDPTVDYYELVAGEVWGKENEKAYRQVAKTLALSLIYGVGINKLARQIKKSVDEAKAYKKRYFARMPMAEDFVDRIGLEAENDGFVTNRFGRRYSIQTYGTGHNANLSSVATNYLVQGSSADIVKNRMVALRKFFKQQACLSHILLQVHDELACEIADDELELVPKIKKLMEHRLISTFLPVEVARGNPSWGQKVKVKLNEIQNRQIEVTA